MSDHIQEIVARFNPLIEKATAADAKAIIEAIRLQTVVMATLLDKIEKNTGRGIRAEEAMRSAQQAMQAIPRS